MGRVQLLAILCLLGCRSAAPGPSAAAESRIGRSQAELPAFRVDGADGVRSNSDICTLSFQSASAVADAINGPIRLTVRDAVRIARATNPDLVAIRQNESVAVAALEVARTYPFNPQASVDVRPFTRERNGDSAATLVSTSIQQEIELAHQGSFRARVGEAELDRTRWSLFQAEVATTALAEQRFFGALYQRQRLGLAISLAEMNQQLLGVLQRRFEAGQSTATDLSLARIQIAATQQQADLARVTYETALADLQTVLGLPSEAVIELEGDLERYQWQPLSDLPPRSDAGDAATYAPAKQSELEVSARLMSRRPDIRAAEAEVNAARARLELACASRTPNVKIGPVYEHDEAGTQFFGMEASMALPVVNTGEPLVRQRHAELHQRTVALEQLQQKAKLEIQAALRRYMRSRQAAESYAKNTSPELLQQVRIVEEQFNAGQTDLLRVYSARASLIQSQQAQLDSLQELARAAAALSAATGLGPDLFLSNLEEGEP